MKALPYTLTTTFLLILFSCGSAKSEKGKELDPKENYSGKGVGPIENVQTGSIDSALAAKGEVLFSGACTSCHIYDQKHVGPALEGVTDRRTPEWIMNMILNPKEMTSEDPMASRLKSKYHQQMNPDGQIDSADARALLQYLRWKDSGN